MAETSEPRYEATLACGDTVSASTLPTVGSYRLCIHCESRKRVTAVTDSWQRAADAIGDWLGQSFGL